MQESGGCLNNCSEHPVFEQLHWCRRRVGGQLEHHRIVGASGSRGFSSAKWIPAAQSLVKNSRVCLTLVPFDIATCMYYTGLDPFTGQEVYVARHLRDRKLQRALLQFLQAGKLLRGPQGPTDSGPARPDRPWLRRVDTLPAAAGGFAGPDGQSPKRADRGSVCAYNRQAWDQVASGDSP